MTQPTVEERLNEKLKLCISRIGGINCQCGNPISLNRINDLWIDFIKSEIQFAEQKVREELKQTIIEKIEEYAKSQTDQHTKYAIMGCISLINEI